MSPHALINHKVAVILHHGVVGLLTNPWNYSTGPDGGSHASVFINHEVAIGLHDSVVGSLNTRRSYSAGPEDSSPNNFRDHEVAIVLHGGPVIAVGGDKGITYV